MNIPRKLDIAKEAVNSILRHDDASLQDRAGAADQLIDYIKDEFSEAQKRRAAKVNEEAKEE